MLKDPIDESHMSLLKALDDRRFCRVVPLGTSAPSNHVADGPSKSYVLDASGNRVGVLIVSSSVSPQLIARSVIKAREAKQALGESLGSVILEPMVDDVFSDLSFALWPLHRDLSSSRIVRYSQKRRVRRKALRWLAAATRQTMRSDLELEERPSRNAIALARMTEEARFGDALRSAASRALDDLKSESFVPATVLQHSDLWLGNFLLPIKRNANGRNAHGFLIIDWAGATVSGHPFFDLLRFSMSSGVSPVRLRSEIRVHCKILGCRLVDAVSYTLAALGVLGMNLEQFPEARYLDMSQRVFETMSTALAD